MILYCTERFKKEYESLKKKNSYANLPKLLTSVLLNSKAEQLIARSSLLNNSTVAPYLKTRIGGRSGYRSYAVLVIRDGKAYLGFIHPKTGKMGASNVTKDAEKAIYGEIATAIADEKFYIIEKEEGSDQLVFKKQ